MPIYEYHCASNGRVVEVAHRMSERFETWGEVCENAHIELGDTPADTPVAKLIGGGSVNNLNNTLSKIQTKHGERSKSLNHGPMAAPPRNNRY